MERLVYFENLAFIVTFILYIIATVLYFIYFLKPGERIGKLAPSIIIAGLAIHTLALVLRTVVAGRPPLSNQYEFASVFAWGIVLCYIVLELKYKSRYQIFGAFVMPLAIVVMAYAASLPKDIRPLMPALQSWWLKVHVGAAILAYGAFAIACGLAVMYLYRSYKEESGKISGFVARIPELVILDDFIYKTVAFGFVFQTLLIVTGAIWAEQAWGRYWGWDPKETWSLITWFIYAIYLHARFTRGWAGRKTAWFTIIGFICVLFTYIGVNMLLPGIHSYL